MCTFSEYKEFVKKTEENLLNCAFHSEDVKYLDGSTFNEYYEDIFNSKDYFAQDRNRYRTPMQVERDRIIYSNLFSRLAQKTQLFTTEQKGITENRYSHTLKVQQISSLSLLYRCYKCPLKPFPI
jgi:hypothetical protein